MKRMIALLLSAACLFCAGCTAREDTPQESGTGYKLWFAADGGNEHADRCAVGQEARSWVSEPTAEGLMTALLGGPESHDLESPFPAGVKLLSLTVEEATGTATVDLSEQYATLTGFDLTLADCCIALTLCQREDIRSVKVTVEGSAIPYRNRQTLTAGDMLLSGIDEAPDTFLAVLYFPNRRLRTLTVEYRQMPREEGDRAEDLVMAGLLDGPAEQTDHIGLPEGTRVRSLVVRDNLCQIDLSAGFLDNAPENEELARLTLFALVNSLCALSGVSQVQILVEGEPVESYAAVPAGAPLGGNYDLVA